MKTVSKTLDEIRSDACNVILVTFALLAMPAVGASVLRGIQLGWKPVMAVHVLFLLVLIYAAVRRRYLSLNVRAAVVTAVPFLVTIAGFLTYGRGNGTLMFMITSCVLAGCFFDLRGALVALGLSFVGLAALFISYTTGLVDVPVNRAIFEMTAMSWLSLGVAVLAAAAVPLVGISALLRSLDAERARADEAARVRSDFLASISHELRTPMANILGLAEALKGTQLDAHQHSVIANLVLSGRNLLSILNDLLDFTKFETGKVLLEKRSFRLSEEIRSICAPFEMRATQKGIYFGIELAPDLPEGVVGDKILLGQAISNLVDNAVKFTASGGVVVRVEQAPREDDLFTLVCSVIDTGIGVASEHSARIFEPFIQVDMSTSRVYGGAGLGLAICRNLAAALGGDLTVSSELGAGSTFTLRIPLGHDVGSLLPGVPSLPRHTSASAPPIRRRPLRLLVVDDDPNMRTVAEIILTERGHDVTLVDDGAAGVAAVMASGPEGYDCVIMDMHMPGMNGPGAMRMLRSAEAAAGVGRHVPIIALSADVLPEHVRTFLEAGADAFIAKPVTWDALEAKMQELAERASASVTPA